MSDTNPKAAQGALKCSLSLVPPELRAYASIGLAEGAAKYGKDNYLMTPIDANIYYEAINRHLDLWWLGQETDVDTGVPHLASVAANIALLVASKENGNLNDNRPPAREHFLLLLQRAAAIQRSVGEVFKDKNPRHYTIKDRPYVEPS
jgi:Domain of unknown function (DUF5664)